MVVKFDTIEIELSPLYELFTKTDRNKEADNNNRMTGEERIVESSQWICTWIKTDRSMVYMYFIFLINIFGELFGKELLSIQLAAMVCICL